MKIEKVNKGFILGLHLTTLSIFTQLKYFNDDNNNIEHTHTFSRGMTTLIQAPNLFWVKLSINKFFLFFVYLHIIQTDDIIKISIFLILV